MTSTIPGGRIRRFAIGALVVALALLGLPTAATAATTGVDCDAATDDILAVQTAVTAATDGDVIELGGTCDFTAAPAHGGDVFLVQNAAVLVSPDAINGLTIRSASSGQATILGAGDEAAFVITPDAQNVTITGLRFVNLGRAIVAINTSGTTIGSAAGATVPDAGANRIISTGPMSSAILAVATSTGLGGTPNVTTVNYGGATTTPAAVALTANLTNLKVLGNYVSFNPPVPPDGSTRDVVGVDVRTRGRSATNVEISRNAVGMFTSEFPSFNMNGIRVFQHGSAGLYTISNLQVNGNNLGRLEEADGPVDGNVGDIHAAGRAAIVIRGANGYTVSGNGLRSRLSPTAIPMPGGGIVISDSTAGTISANGIIVVADPSTLSSDLGAIGIVDDVLKLFAFNETGAATSRALIRDNIVGIVGDDQNAPLGAQRALVLNGASHVSAINNTVKHSSSFAVNMGVVVEGPGSVSDPGPKRLQGPVNESVVCRNMLDDLMDNGNEIAYDQASAGSANSFPFGNAYPGNMACAPTVSLSSGSLNAGDPLTVTGKGWAARSVSVTLSGTGASPITKTAVTSADGSYSAAFTGTEIGAFADGILTVTAVSKDDLSTLASTPTGANLRKGNASTMTYDNAVHNALPLPDVTGQGLASATASSDRNTGALSAEVSASDTLPAGVAIFGVGIGSSAAYAHSRVLHNLTLSGGSHVITATLVGVNATSSAAGTYLPYIAGAYANTYAAATMVYQCQTGCPTNSQGQTVPTVVYDAAYQYLSCAPASPACSNNGTVQLSVTLTVPAGETGKVLVDAGLFAGATVSGAGNASARVSGTVLSITTAAA